MNAALLVPLATGNRALTIGLFLAVVAVTLYITFWASRQKRPPLTTTQAAARSAASRMGWPSAATTCPPRPFSASPARSPCTATTASSTPSASGGVARGPALLVAELLRNSGASPWPISWRTGCVTPVRTAAATSTIVVSIFYLLAQMVGAGALVGLLGVDTPVSQESSSSSSLSLMIIYVTFGG